MTTRLIEECLELERLEDSPVYLMVEYWVINPYLTGMALLDMRSGKITRLGSPGWGRNDIEKCIKRMEILNATKHSS